MTKLKKYAFWGYDLFPFFLGAATNGRRLKDSRVSVPAYGVNATVKPILLVSADEGERIKTEVAAIKAEYEKGKAALYRDAQARILSLHPGIHKFFINGK